MPLYKLIILGIVALNPNLGAQTEFTAQIVDSLTGMPVKEALVRDNYGNQSLSSQNGTFNLITPDSIVSISCPGYQTPRSVSPLPRRWVEPV